MRKAILLIMLLLLASVASAEQFIYTGFVLGDCKSGANVTVTLYDEGFLNNPGNVVDTAYLTSAADGTFGGASGVVAHAAYDINISVENPACSASAIGSVALLSQWTDALPNPPAVIDQNVTQTTIYAASTPADGATSGDNTTTFTWNSDYTANYRLEISTNVGFTAMVLNQSGIVLTTYTLTAPQALPDNTYYWRVVAYNGSGTMDTTSTRQLIIAAGAAMISNPSPENSSWRNTTTMAFSFTTDKDAECRYATAASTPFASKTVFATTGAQAHSDTVPLSSEGANSLYVQCNTTAGVVNPADTLYVFNRDTAGPVAGTVSIDGGAAVSLDTTLDFTWAGFTDAGVGVASYYYSFTNGGGTTSGTNDAASPGQLSGAAQGTVSVYVWAVDSLGNIGSAASDTIFVDSLPPSFSGWNTFPVDLTKYSAGSFTVWFTVTDISGLSSTPQFRYRIGSDAWSSWTNATFINSGGSNYNYRFIIDEQASPSTWFERSSEYLYYDVRANDTYGRNNSVSRSEYINNESTAPTLSAITDKTVAQGTTLSFNITGSDVDLNTLTYSCNLSSATVSKVNDNLATVSWTPGNGDVGAYPAHCNVTDGTFTTTQTFTVTVTNVNDDPILEAIGSLYAQEYVFFNYTLNASDPDNDTLSYYSNSSIFSVNRLTGSIGFTPFSMQRGVYRINYSIQDGNGGFDYEEASFTIGYCGDGTCRSGFETCTSCEADCGVCSEEATKAILVEPRNCLDEQMNIQAVTLVTRATCEEKGLIVDSMEVCGNESGQNLKVSIMIDDETWEEVAQLLTDDDGYATFTPGETGEYRVAYAGDADIYTPFEIKACQGEDEEPATPVIKPAISGPDEEPPVLEEPTIIDEVPRRWTLFSILLYFIIIPLLLILLVISGLGVAYNVQVRKGMHNKYVTTVEAWITDYRRFKAQAVSWMRKTPPFDSVLKYLVVAAEQTADACRFAKDLVVEYYFKAVVALGLRRRIRLEYFNLQAPGKAMHLLLVSVLKNLAPERRADELLALVYEYSIRSLLDLAAMLMSFGAKVTYVDEHAENVPYLNALIAKGMTFRPKAHTRVHLESELQAGRPVVCLLNELGERNSIVQSAVVLYAFDKNYFYFHDYPKGKSGLRMGKDQFMKGWQATGFKSVFVRK